VSSFQVCRPNFFFDFSVRRAKKGYFDEGKRGKNHTGRLLYLSKLVQATFSFCTFKIKDKNSEYLASKMKLKQAKKDSQSPNAQMEETCKRNFSASDRSRSMKSSFHWNEIRSSR
jgi:hypothetical protein